jgi:class 3 adenylate cyclase/tetratricopeptide (TPR) repeat protein
MLSSMAQLTCQQCGAPLPEDARFCPRCGSPVAALLTEERKVVTILFADLAGSTKLAAQLDPERFREVMAAFFRSVSTELESLRGRAEKFVGDAVMAVWGVPHAHDDDALRAVRAGFAIRDRTARLGQALALAVPLRVRVGINSGAVATGSGPADQFLVAGAAVNMAARLQEAAEPDEILVGETTWQLTQHAVDFGPARSVSARGFPEDAKAWPVSALTARSTRRTIPLVGRRRELRLLVDTFDRARENGHAHLVTILGEPGIGKSRLVEEFVAGLPEDARVLVGRASEFEEDVTFAPIADMVRRELGAERDTPPAELHDRLEKMVSECCGPVEADRVVARLGLALGLGLDVRERDPEKLWDESLARFEEYVESEGRERHRYRSAEVRAGLERLLEGMAQSGPVVMVLEDLQLARPDLLELVEDLLRRNRELPVLVLCPARDELLNVRPDWGGGIPDAVTFRLDPLQTEEAKELAMMAGEALDEPTARRIAERAGGNPFFIIETTGMLLQRHEAHVAGASHEHLLPLTVQAVVASRLDHLSDDSRDLIRKASVFARSTFSNWELSLIAESNQDVLRDLEEEEFLVRDPERPGVWRFRHDMLRVVTYETLSKRDRLRLHLQVADGISASEEADRYPQVIAYHLAQAAQASLDLEPGDRTVPDRAVKATAKAADIARRRMESRTAIDLYLRALDLAGPEEGWGQREGRILAGIGEARYWLGDFELARADLTKAIDVAGGDAWTRTHALRFLADITLNFSGDPNRATELFGEALAAAGELGDAFGMARTLLMAAWAPYWRDDLATSQTMFEEALRIARENPEGDRWVEARALVSLTSIISPQGDEEESLELGLRGLELGRAMDDPFTIAVADEAVGNSLRRMMRLDEALPYLDEAVRTFRDLGARWEFASALGDRADIHRLSGRLQEAEADLEESLEVSRRLGERSLIRWTARELVRVSLAQGKRESAQRILDDPSVWIEIKDNEANWSRAFAEVLVALDEGNREGALERALEILRLGREEGWPNPMASDVWWVGKVFGPEAAGGEQALEAARKTLDAAHWYQALREPELVPGLEPA